VGGTGNSSKGLGWQGGGRRGAHGDDGEESGTREGTGEGEKGPARILTITRSF
jgi:hypothetical protein